MSDQTNSYEGGCACGHVRYRMQSDPMVVHGCHCRFCQRQNGSAFAVNALIEADQVELLQGDVVDVEVSSPSGKGQKIARCKACQLAVWSNYLIFRGGLGEKIRFVRVGTLDDPDSMPPDVHIHTSSKQPWVQLPPDAAAFDEYYDTKEVWLPESLARIKALMDK